MLVVMRPIESIRPYENNPRLNDAAVDAVARSIQEFGFRQPIVVDEDGVIIVGHTRYKAALKLGLTEVPVHVAVGLTPAQVKAYRIADNQTATAVAGGTTTSCRSGIGGTAGDGLRPGPDRVLGGRLAAAAGAGDRRGTDRPRRHSRAARRGDHAARRPVDPRQPPPAVRRQQQGRGRGPAARRRADPSGQHRPAVQRQRRAALQQRHRRRPVVVPGHDAPPGVRRGAPPGEGAADAHEDAGQGPAAGQRLRLRRGVRPAAARLVRQHGPRAAAGPRLLHLGRLRQHRQLPAGPEGARAVLQPDDHLGQGASGADPQGFHGQPRMVLLRLETKAPPTSSSARTTPPTSGP